MKILADSSVLIAAFVEAHPKHPAALAFLSKAKKGEFEFFVAAHSVLEIFSVLTGAPFKPKITPETAKKLIDNNIRAIAQIVSLSAKEYWKLVEKMSDFGLTGGIVYDAIIVECALKINADEIVTLNTSDFLRLTGNDAIRIATV